ncbi:MAG TPA: GNAT family N-acetyltransferase [Solirubrobacteraceae bacterium]|nr:GNAT family N-acetyltransferase [Solirubrobacteraceae bacterium]
MIETERLLLRRFALPDVDDFVALQADREVRRYIQVAQPFGREQATERVQNDEAEWQERGRRLLAIEERAGGRFLGRVTLHDWAQFGETEIGWALRGDARGQGFATEAARAYMAWGFRNLDVPYLTAMIRPDNGPSIAVAARLGMTEVRTDVLSGNPVVVYAVSRRAFSGRS